MHPKIRPVGNGRPSFLGAPRCTALELLDADIAILGMPFTTPEDLSMSRCPCSEAPDAVRVQSQRLAGVLTHFDFDLGGSVFDGRTVSIADCGDVWGEPGKFEQNGRAATGIVELIREAGALPIILGGDHAAVLPTLRAYADQRSLRVVHIGAELHWCDAIAGVREGASTGMRRASELPWITSMIQFGLRGLGRARPQDVEDALGFGSKLVAAEQIHEHGVEAVLGKLPRGGACWICLDADGLDPSIAPGVELPAFGGLSYFEASNLLKAFAATGPVLGVALLGIVPRNDVNDMTSLLGVRLILNLLGALARAARFDTRASSASPVSALVHN